MSLFVLLNNIKYNLYLIFSQGRTKSTSKELIKAYMGNYLCSHYLISYYLRMDLYHLIILINVVLLLRSKFSSFTITFLDSFH